jgi:hypothetical protein
MKVIGNGRYNVILEATPDEVNRLAGKTLYQWNSYHDRWELESRVGTEFNVREGIEQLHHNAERTAEVARLKQQLQSIILQLELIEPFMKEPEVVASKEEGIA